DERNTLLDCYRTDPDPQLRLRAHIVLLLAAGHTWATIAAVLFCSSRTIARWKRRFQDSRADGLLGRPRGAAGRCARWAAVGGGGVTARPPGAFGFRRGRWCCPPAALLLWREYRVDVSRETVRRWLHRHDIVWRRPRPVLRRRDPQREEILAGLRRVLRGLPDDETAGVGGEGGLELNPAIGRLWMGRGGAAAGRAPPGRAPS